MSDTPMTEAIIRRVNLIGGSDDFVMPEDCRKIEKELVKANEQSCVLLEKVLDDRSELLKQRALLLDALRKITGPISYFISYFREEAYRNGERLDEAACVALATDFNYLESIAHAALIEIDKMAVGGLALIDPEDYRAAPDSAKTEEKRYD